MRYQVRASNALNNGFTILELMMAVAFLGVILALGVPSFTDYVARQAVKADVNRISKAFTSARSQAMTISAGLTSVCWNPADVAATPANLVTAGAIIPARSVAVFEGGPASATGYGETLSIVDISIDRLSYRTSDADNCIGFNSQGRLIQSNVAGVSFVICKAAADASDAYRIDIAAGGRLTLRENTSAQGNGVLSCN